MFSWIFVSKLFLFRCHRCVTTERAHASGLVWTSPLLFPLSSFATTIDTLHFFQLAQPQTTPPRSKAILGRLVITVVSCTSTSHAYAHPDIDTHTHPNSQARPHSLSYSHHKNTNTWAQVPAHTFACIDRQRDTWTLRHTETQPHICTSTISPTEALGIRHPRSTAQLPWPMAGVVPRWERTLGSLVTRAQSTRRTTPPTGCKPP